MKSQGMTTTNKAMILFDLRFLWSFVSVHYSSWQCWITRWLDQVKILESNLSILESSNECQQMIPRLVFHSSGHQNTIPGIVFPSKNSPLVDDGFWLAFLEPSIIYGKAMEIQRRARTNIDHLASWISNKFHCSPSMERLTLTLCGLLPLLLTNFPTRLISLQKRKTFIKGAK